MHTEVLTFVSAIKQLYPDMFFGKDVLDCGSYDINGSTRQFFQSGSYHGIDLHLGDGVDEVISIVGHFEKHRYITYDVIISTECMEHNSEWQESWNCMKSALRPGGLMIMTCAGPKRKEHGTTKFGPNLSPATNNYYGNRHKGDFPIPITREFELAEYHRNLQDLYIAYKV